jgi:hypothetical protein
MSVPRRSLEHAARRRDETQRLLVRALLRRVDEGRFSVDDAVDVALVQIGRPGGPQLSEEQRRALRRSFATLARSLTPPSPRAVYTFARAAAELAWQAETPARSPGAVVQDAARGTDTRALARAAVYAEWMRASDDEDLLRRAVHRATQERRKAQPGILVPLAPHDPLRELLALSSDKGLRLPARDLRGTIARVAADNAVVGGVLRKAARFARHVLAPALGDELWALCRPIGFSDRTETRVLVAVENSLAAQEAQLGARALVARLKEVPGFERVTGIRVTVDPHAYWGEPRPPSSTSPTTSKSSR